MHIFNFILWNVSPEIFSIGPLKVRWYGLLFAMGFLLGQQILIRIYRGEGRSEKDVETLTVYMVIATILGARLGHALFYQPELFLDPIELLSIWNGGLASHGAAIGILIAIYLYSRKATGQSYFYVLDRMVITIALAGCLIRLGNLMNSEIIGKPSDVSTAFLFVNETDHTLENRYPEYIKNVKIAENGTKIENQSNGVPLEGIDINIHFKKNKIDRSSIPDFVQKTVADTIGQFSSIQENVLIPARVEPVVSDNSDGSFSATVKAYAIPRLPSQLYESISSFVLFLILWFVYTRKRGKTPEGRIFGLFLVILFSLRLIYEYGKENQVAFESDLVAGIGFNMGQILSIPLILAGIFILMRSFLKKNEIE